MPAGAADSHADWWHLIFVDLEAMGVKAPWHWRWFFKPFTRPGFRHSLAVYFDADADAWILYETNLQQTTIKVLTDEELDGLFLVARQSGGAVVRVPVANRCMLRFPRPLYCVSSAVHLLGLNTFALTPWQLFRHVTGLDGSVIVIGAETHVLRRRQTSP